MTENGAAVIEHVVNELAEGRKRMKAAKQGDEAVMLAPPNRFVEVDEEPPQNVTSLRGIIRVKDELIRLDSKNARTVLNLPTFEGERPLRKAWVRYLIRAIRRETYLPEDVTIKTCWVGKKRFRINGQHTCTAVINIDKAHPGFSLNVRYIEYRAKNMEQMRTLYTSQDRGATRTVGNQIVALLVGTHGYEEVRQNTLRRLSEGLNMHLNDTHNGRKNMDAQVRADFLREPRWKDIALQIAAILDGGSEQAGRHMMRSAVVGAMFSTFETSPKLAKQFWTGVRDGANLPKDSPQLRLHRWLIERGVSDRGGSQNKARVSSEQMYRQCIHIWNRWRDGETKIKEMRAPLNTKARPKVR